MAKVVQDDPYDFAGTSFTTLVHVQELGTVSNRMAHIDTTRCSEFPTTSGSSLAQNHFKSIQ
eukprot:13027290-Ditylum_brightwellii.AAC.1